MMRVEHLSCACLCPRGWPWLIDAGSDAAMGEICCHCLLIHGEEGLILVDTGFGRADLRAPARRLGRAFTAVARPRRDESLCAIHQIEARGFRASDVRHIVLTHLDLDHAGGLSDFPQAQVHVHAAEHAAAMHPHWRERGRYRSCQWQHAVRWQLHDGGGEDWFGLRGLKALPGTADDVQLIPMPGHTRGHCAVAVRSAQGWLLHAGDAYFHHGEMCDPPQRPAAIGALQGLLNTDRAQRLANRDRLRALATQAASQVRVFCAHDPQELARLQGAASWQEA